MNSIQESVLLNRFFSGGWPAVYHAVVGKSTRGGTCGGCAFCALCCRRHFVDAGAVKGMEIDVLNGLKWHFYSFGCVARIKRAGE